MRLTPVAWSLVGSLVVFAACAVQTADRSESPHTQEDSGIAAVVDAVLVEVHAVADAMGVDVAIEPMKDAMAAPLATVTAMCKTTAASAGGNTRYAEAAFPGRSRLDLAQAVIVVAYTSADADGYAHGVGGILSVKDGAVRAVCGANATEVTFVVPPPLTP
jgi:hypothetical protein